MFKIKRLDPFALNHFSFLNIQSHTSRTVLKRKHSEQFVTLASKKIASLSGCPSTLILWTPRVTQQLFLLLQFENSLPGKIFAKPTFDNSNSIFFNVFLP